jgi:hypothetical protein
LNLYDLQRKVEFRKPLTDEERTYVESKTADAMLIDTIRANAILAISETVDRRAAALDKLEGLCGEHIDGDAKASFALINGLMYLVDPLPPTGRLRAFAFRMATKGSVSCRVNAVWVLERLAWAGDAAAKQLIEECTTDSDQHVRERATTALRHL